MTVVRLVQPRVTPVDDFGLDAATEFALKGWSEAYRSHLPASRLAARTRDDFARHLESRRNGSWVALVNERPAGLLTVHSNCIDDLWVARRYRRRGIATRLLAVALDHLRERGFQFAQAGCEDFHVDGLAFFAAAGWRQIGAETLWTLPGLPVTATVWSRRL